MRDAIHQPDDLRDLSETRKKPERKRTDESRKRDGAQVFSGAPQMRALWQKQDGYKSERASRQAFSQEHPTVNPAFCL
jgi:hypothetical protein